MTILTPERLTALQAERDKVEADRAQRLAIAREAGRAMASTRMTWLEIEQTANEDTSGDPETMASGFRRQMHRGVPIETNAEYVAYVGGVREVYVEVMASTGPAGVVIPLHPETQQ